MATRERVKGHEGPHGMGRMNPVAPKCCGVRVPQAAVGAPVGRAEMSAARLSRRSTGSAAAPPVAKAAILSLRACTVRIGAVGLGFVSRRDA